MTQVEKHHPSTGTDVQDLAAVSDLPSTPTPLTGAARATASPIPMTGPGSPDRVSLEALAALAWVAGSAGQD
jgi:hypothetical protein